MSQKLLLIESGVAQVMKNLGIGSPRIGNGFETAFGGQQSLNYVFVGNHSDLQISTREPVFVVLLADTVRSRDQVLLSKVKVTSTKREMIGSKTFIPSDPKSIGTIPITIETKQVQYGGRTMTFGVVKPTSPLSDGEYVFRAFGLCHDFGIKSSSKNPR